MYILKWCLTLRTNRFNNDDWMLKRPGPGLIYVRQVRNHFNTRIAWSVDPEMKWMDGVVAGMKQVNDDG